MPEWEAFYFHKFLKNGYLVCISKTVRISSFCWKNLFRNFVFDNLSHAEVLAPYLQSYGHLNVKNGVLALQFT